MCVEIVWENVFISLLSISIRVAVLPILITLLSTWSLILIRKNFSAYGGIYPSLRFDKTDKYFPGRKIRDRVLSRKTEWPPIAFLRDFRNCSRLFGVRHEFFYLFFRDDPVQFFSAKAFF